MSPFSLFVLLCGAGRIYSVEGVPGLGRREGQPPGGRDRDCRAGRRIATPAGRRFLDLELPKPTTLVSAPLTATFAIAWHHAAYLASSIAVLKADKRTIFTAAALAQKAVDRLTDKADYT